jgi:predicted dehydrogenase
MKVVVTGVSHWHAPMHLAGVARAGSRVVGVCDADARVARAVGVAHGIPVAADLAELLERFEPDVVIVMGRPEAALADAGILVDAGVPCIVEKPIGLDGASLAGLVERVRDRGAFVSVPLANRYGRIWERLAALEADRRRGRVRHAHFRIVNGPPERYEAAGVGWMLDPAAAGGGCLRNLGIHGVDACLQLAAGEPIEVASSVMDTPPGGGAIETFAAVTLRTPSGFVATIEAGYTFAGVRGGDMQWRIATDNAYLIDDGAALREATLDDGRDVTQPIAGADARYDTYLADTLRRLGEGAPPKVTLADFQQASQLIDHLYERAAPAGARA